MRNLQFQTGEYYHIYNRGTDGRNIFCDKNDYVRFIKSIRELNNNSKKEERDYILRKLKDKRGKELSSGYPELSSFLRDSSQLVEFICYAFLPNHYHFLLKQKKERGIEKFMHKLSLSYTNYFNFKYFRSGSLFQGTYKAVHIENDNYLLQLSCYINGNPEIHRISKAENWIWSSYKDYLGIRNGSLSDKKIILKDFNDIIEYKYLIEEIIRDSSKRKEEIAQYLLE